jgi:hypothetical protein
MGLFLRPYKSPKSFGTVKAHASHPSHSQRGQIPLSMALGGVDGHLGRKEDGGGGGDPSGAVGRGWLTLGACYSVQRYEKNKK